jgi:hypothetical protein
MNKLPNFDDLRKLYPALFEVARDVGMLDSDAFKLAERAYIQEQPRGYVPLQLQLMLLDI